MGLFLMIHEIRGYLMILIELVLCNHLKTDQPKKKLMRAITNGNMEEEIKVGDTVVLEGDDIPSMIDTTCEYEVMEIDELSDSLGGGLYVVIDNGTTRWGVRLEWLKVVNSISYSITEDYDKWQ